MDRKITNIKTIMTESTYIDSDLRPCDIVYFDYLHLGTAVATPRSGCSHRSWASHYCIEGKARPVLILDELNEDFGVKWYRILKVTTKDYPERNSQKIGPVFSEKVSYVSLEPELYPINLRSSREPESNEKKTMSRLACDSIRKIMVSSIQGNNPAS